MYSIAQHSIKRITANIKFLNLPSGVLSHRSLSAHFDDDNIQFSLRCETSNTYKQAGASLSHKYFSSQLLYRVISSISDKNYRNINKEEESVKRQKLESKEKCIKRKAIECEERKYKRKNFFHIITIALSLAHSSSCSSSISTLINKFILETISKRQ